MQATRILPDLQCSLVCEDVRQEANGNLILIGVVTVVRVPQIPVTVGRLVIFNRWTAGIGQFTESTRFVAPDQTTVLHKGEVKFELREPSHFAINVMPFGPVKLEAAGTYYVEVLVDDVMKLRYPVMVMHTPMPSQTTTTEKPPVA